MNVQELIDELNKIENKDLQVEIVFNGDCRIHCVKEIKGWDAIVIATKQDINYEQ